MSSSQATVIAPATTANLGPGFDVFGLALRQPHDKVTLTAIPKGVKLEVAGLWSKIVLLPRKNTASTVANHIIREFDLKTGVHIKIDRNIMPGVGLGSSAASAAAVACGLNSLFNLLLDKKDLVRLAAKGERVSAGYGHADNVSAAVYGDFTVVRSYDPLEIVNTKAPDNMEVCVAYPHMETSAQKTANARKLLPKQVPMKNVVHNIGSAAAIASGFASGDVDLIGKSMSDAIVEPARAELIPAYHKVKKEALKGGACGVAISGAGPAMIGVVNRMKVNTSKVVKAMKDAFESTGLKATAFATTPGRGAYVLEMEK